VRVVEVVGADDPRIADYAGLTDVALRQRFETEHGLFLAESELVIRRAIAAGYQPRSMLMSRRWFEAMRPLLDSLADDLPVFVASDPVITGVTGYHVHRGALASMNRRPGAQLDQVLAGAQRVLVLEGTVDHTNVGAAFRSAAGLGYDAVLLDPRAADPLYRRAVRVSMGAVFDLAWARLPGWPGQLDVVRERGFTVVALTPDPDAVTLAAFSTDPPQQLALLVGTEGPGLSRQALAASDVRVQIPMRGRVDSLNVAAAVAVACYALGPPGAPRGEST
jgi:tRNA G18 (ribose-2'-O)-methylase SpoU